MSTFGQLDEIYKNREILDTAFSNIGGTKLETTYIGLALNTTTRPLGV